MIIQPGLLYLTRSEWGANRTIPRLGYTVARSNRTKAIIHHTVIVDSDATRNLWTDLAEVKAKMQRLQTIRPDLGMDVPYNFVMFLMEDGSVIVCEGRGLDRTGAHTKGHNTDGIATALQGNFMLAVDLVPYVPAISRWWGWLKYDQGMNNLGKDHPAGQLMYGHRDFRDPNDTSTWTSCPGDNLQTIIPQLTFKEDGMAWTEDEVKHVENMTRVIDGLLAMVGQPPAFGNDYPPETYLLASLDAADAHAGDVDRHLNIQQIRENHNHGGGEHGHPHQHGEAG